jgi:hydroxymethylpyrimidine pyrophosphatase-like HAD family hydrolase
MKYKAIIMDVDGTSVPNAKDAIPTQRVVSAIEKAQKLIYVSACTSRPIFLAKDVITLLKIKDPCGINDATQIYDPVTKKIIKTFALAAGTAQKAASILFKKNIKFFVNVGETEEYYKGEDFKSDICSICVPEVPVEKKEEMKELFVGISDIAIQTPPSYKKGLVWINITSAVATKLHSVHEITKMLGVLPDETIGIGDGYNDFPLLEACGLKIAMGNAVPELKAIADFVAPSVDEDGVATVIEKFILH